MVLVFILTFGLLAGPITEEAGSAGTGSITGIVRTSYGSPLVGATVMVVGTSYGAMTDENGEYTIINLSPGSYILEARMVGMSSQSTDAHVESDSETVIDFRLEACAMWGSDPMIVIRI